MICVASHKLRDLVRTTFFERLKNLQAQRRTSICCGRDFAVLQFD
jgi:hypothetical protein